MSEQPQIHRVVQKHVEGTTVNMLNTVTQRICEVDFISHSLDEIKSTIKDIQDAISVLDIHGEQMIEHPFDVSRIMSSPK